MPDSAVKVAFVFKAAPDTTDYYSYVLDRLAKVTGVSVLVIAGGTGNSLGTPRAEHVFSFRRCDEKQWPGGEFRLPELPDILSETMPDIVVTVPEYLLSFRRDRRLRGLRKRLGFKVLLKSIPFRVPTLDEFRARKMERLRERLFAPSRWQRPFLKVGMVGRGIAGAIGLARRVVGSMRVGLDCRRECRKWRIADGHVNYIDDAFRVYGSYGVPGEHIHVIGNSPDTDRLLEFRMKVEREGVTRRPHRLLHVGRMVEWKRVDLLLRAAHLLKPKYPDLDVVIAGEGPMADTWRRLSDELGQQDYVRFVGGVYEPLAVARLFMESGVYVLAGMGGISINDAMCYGCPVVCSVCDGTERKLVRHGETGFVFENGNLEGLASAIERLLDAPALQRSLASGGMRVIAGETNVHSVLRGYVLAFQEETGGQFREALAGIEADRSRAEARWRVQVV